MNTICYGYSLYDFITKLINRLVTDVPEMDSTDNKIYHLQYIQSVSSAKFMRATNGPFLSLNAGFNQIVLVFC